MDLIVSLARIGSGLHQIALRIATLVMEPFTVATLTSQLQEIGAPSGVIQVYMRIRTLLIRLMPPLDFRLRMAKIIATVEIQKVVLCHGATRATHHSGGVSVTYRDVMERIL